MSETVTTMTVTVLAVAVILLALLDLSTGFNTKLPQRAGFASISLKQQFGVPFTHISSSSQQPYSWRQQNPSVTVVRKPSHLFSSARSDVNKDEKSPLKLMKNFACVVKKIIFNFFDTIVNFFKNIGKYVYYEALLICIYLFYTSFNQKVLR